MIRTKMLDFDDFKTLLRRRSRLTISNEQTYCERSIVDFRAYFAREVTMAENEMPAEQVRSVMTKILSKPTGRLPTIFSWSKRAFQLCRWARRIRPRRSGTMWSRV